MARQKLPNHIDKHVGTRVRMRRMMLDMSQTELGDALDITFQQVQNTKKALTGSARAGSRQTCHTLQVSVPFFFEGAPTGNALPGRPSPDPLTDLMATRDGLALVTAFMRIADVRVRLRIVNLVEEIVDHQD
jgi:hypothetical protein